MFYEGVFSLSYSLLIIDCEPLFCMSIKEMVDWGSLGFHRVDMRFSYDDGLKAALTHNYTLIFTEVRLHDKSGLSLIRQLRQQETTSNFVIISAFAEFSYAQTAMELGVFQYLLKPFPRDALDACINRFLNQYQRRVFVDPPADPPDRQDRRRTARIDRILDFIHDNYADPTLSLGKVASAFFLNASYLGQRFRLQTGVKFTDYLNQYRIVKACDLLLKTQYLTYEISEMVGFANINYFHRVFKRITGVGTEEYRHKAPHGQIKAPSLPEKSDLKEVKL